MGRVRAAARRLAAWEAPPPGWKGGLTRYLRHWVRWSRLMRWDPFVRYRAAVRALARRLDPQATILDVGAGAFGLSRYARWPCVAIDVAPFPPIYRARHPPIAFVCGTATQMPFRDGAFEAAVAMDLFEHLPREARPLALDELFRTALRTVLIGVPYGREAHNHDRTMLLVERRDRNPSGWRDEHLRHGIPDEGFHRLVVEEAVRRGASVRWFGNENLWALRARQYLQRLIPLDTTLYGVAAAPLALLSLLPVGRRYRRVYVIDLPAAG